MLKIKRKQILAAVVAGTIIVSGIPVVPESNPTAVRVEAATKKKNGWSGSYYYKNGKKVKGLRKIGKYYYYFDSKGKAYTKGWKTIKGKRYYFGKNKRAYTGVKKIGKKYYLFDSKGRRTGTGIRTYGKKKYYVKNGVIKTGMVTYKGKKYYSTRSGLKSGWVTYKGKKYYFSPSNKAMVKNKWVGNSYLGKNGYVTKTKKPSNSKPSTSKPNNNKPSNDKPSEPSYNKNDYWGDANGDYLPGKLEVTKDGIYRYKKADGTYVKNSTVIHVVNGKKTYYNMDENGYAMTGIYRLADQVVCYNGDIVTDKPTVKKALLTIPEFKNFNDNYLKPGMSDVDKLFAIQAFEIDQNFQYDANQGWENDTVMDFFRTKKGMCNDWGRLTFLLSIVADLECEPAYYAGNNHLANIVKIDGVWYHIEFVNNAGLGKGNLDLYSTEYVANYQGKTEYNESKNESFSYSIPLATSHNYTNQSYILNRMPQGDEYCESQGYEYRFGCYWQPIN